MSKKRSNRGGYRQPANPAPVATPNRNRTDGGPGNKKQPLRRLPDADYGANKAFMSGQRAVDGLPKVEPMTRSVVLFSHDKIKAEIIVSNNIFFI